MFAKMPLRISSRMTSAGLTLSSSASSLTVIELGISIAFRSGASSVWTWATAVPVCDGRFWGLRGPRRCRVPLRLRATDGSLLDGCDGVVGDRVGWHGFEASAHAGGHRCVQRAFEGTTLQ